MRPTIDSRVSSWRTEIETVCSVTAPTFAERVITHATEIEQTVGPSDALRAAVLASLDYYRRSSIVLMSVDRETRDARAAAEARLADLIATLDAQPAH